MAPDPDVTQGLLGLELWLWGGIIMILVWMLLPDDRK
jgi:hypothetical protein